MKFTQSQKYAILEEIIQSESGIKQILKMSLAILMKAEREEHNR
ncbi:MAG: hypothetical protein RR356_07950 [Bacteroidales bacterium]